MPQRRLTRVSCACRASNIRKCSSTRPSRSANLNEPAITNNRMELRAAISTLSSLKEPCEVTLFTDSEYLRGGITEWLPRRKANHCRTPTGKR